MEQHHTTVQGQLETGSGGGAGDQQRRQQQQPVQNWQQQENFLFQSLSALDTFLCDPNDDWNRHLLLNDDVCDDQDEVGAGNLPNDQVLGMEVGGGGGGGAPIAILDSALRRRQAAEFERERQQRQQQQRQQKQQQQKQPTRQELEEYIRVFMQLTGSDKQTSLFAVEHALAEGTLCTHDSECTIHSCCTLMLYTHALTAHVLNKLVHSNAITSHSPSLL
jgi:hypothetical protein